MTLLQIIPLWLIVVFVDLSVVGLFVYIARDKEQK
jgi:hypothetical protein